MADFLPILVFGLEKTKRMSRCGYCSRMSRCLVRSSVTKRLFSHHLGEKSPPGALHREAGREDPIGGVVVHLFGLLPPDRYGLVSDIDTGRFQFRRDLLSIAVNEAPSAVAPSANAQGGRRTRASR